MVFPRDFTTKTAYRLRRSRDRHPQRMSGEKCLAKDLAKIVLGRILDHLHLLDDDTLLAF
jgi:hypothetical protein